MENALFEQTCRCAVSLEVGGESIRDAIKRRLICLLSKNFIEHTEFAPPDKPIVQVFVRTVFIRSILPLKSVE